jgi:hypothetical protein
LEPEVTTIINNWPVLAWGLSVAALFGQAWANQREMRKRQDSTNQHLCNLNDKVFTTHGQVQGLCSAVGSLACKTGTIPPWCDKKKSDPNTSEKP